MNLKKIKSVLCDRLNPKLDLDFTSKLISLNRISDSK